MTGESTLGWAFLVARGRVLGYQLLLAPDFLVASGESALLMDEIRGEVPAQGPPMVAELAGPASGPVCVVYRTLRATARDVDGADRPAEPLLDRAGRPLVLTYGFVCQGAGVTGPDEEDLRVAWDAALATYRRFRAAEEAFRTRTSYPYSLRSAVTPAVAPPEATAQAPHPSAAPAKPAPASSAPPSWTAQVLPDDRRSTPVRRAASAGRSEWVERSASAGWSAPVGRSAPAGRSAPVGRSALAGHSGPSGRSVLIRGPASARRRPAILITLIVVLAVAGLVSSAYLLTQSHRPGVRAGPVEIPNVLGQDRAAAVLRLHRANLVPEIRLGFSKRPAGIVIQTFPSAGTRVRTRSRVQVVVSEGARLARLARLETRAASSSGLLASIRPRNAAARSSEATKREDKAAIFMITKIKWGSNPHLFT
jgi:hypothetical protein